MDATLAPLRGQSAYTQRCATEEGRDLIMRSVVMDDSIVVSES